MCGCIAPVGTRTAVILVISPVLRILYFISHAAGRMSGVSTAVLRKVTQI